MNHNVSVLTSIAQCDAFLNANLEEKEGLEYSKASISNRLSTGATTATELAAELTASQQQLNQLNMLLPNIPEGQRRDDMLDDINNLENDIIRLGRRMSNNGPVAVFMREVDLAFVEAKRAENDDIHQQVNTRKSELTV